MRHLRTLTALILGFCGAAAAGAQGMMDPTRPPGGMAAAAGDELVSAGPVLQSVMLSPGRKVAMISGEIVVLGGRYGSARLVKLTESEAVLKNGPETTVLRLFPLVEKRVVGGAKNSPGKTTK
ncbi:MAG: MSHA biogenesis protein MshK [Burkholderiales bacterium]|jgi:MSHA biogenesis protein MshK|nr:MSHA biogenesis protein MshK [Burkholderiales bacterium]